MKKPVQKKMTTEQKYRSLKRQTEQAGMSVREQNGRLVVSRRKPKKNGR
jgi:hypothetical protein